MECEGLDLLMAQAKRLVHPCFLTNRRDSENAYGIMSARWRIRPMLLYPENVDRVTKACVVLHKNMKEESRPGAT